jgi:DNA-binding response OmpR family regulator
MAATPESEADLILLPERISVRAGGREVVLTPTQFRLVAVLTGAPNRVLSRAELVEQAMGTLVEERTVDVHIKEIRRKLGAPGGRIEAVRGRGYRYRGETSKSTEANL